MNLCAVHYFAAGSNKDGLAAGPAVSEWHQQQDVIKPVLVQQRLQSNALLMKSDVGWHPLTIIAPAGCRSGMISICNVTCHAVYGFAWLWTIVHCNGPLMSNS